jgi:polyisoprenoid-binding protein YceI
MQTGFDPTPPAGMTQMAEPSRRSAVVTAVLAVLALWPFPAMAAPGVASTQYADMPAGAYGSDPAHTSVIVRVIHMGFSSYTLRFDKVAAQYRFDPHAPETAQVSADIDPASIDTGSKSFNAELAGKDWLDAADFPSIAFTSTRIDTGDGVHGSVEGNLTLHGVTRPVTLAVTFNGVGGDLIPLVTRAGFSATATVKRSDFGVSRFEGLVGDEVQVTIQAEFTRKLFSRGPEPTPAAGR